MQDMNEMEGCMRPTASCRYCRIRDGICCRLFSILSVYPASNKKRAETCFGGIVHFTREFGMRIGECWKMDPEITLRGDKPPAYRIIHYLIYKMQENEI